MKKGFTLIELLVVVGILGILAVAALIAINPAEAQRKSRDSVRLKDVVTLQTAIEQYVNDKGATALGSVNSTSGLRTCSGGWLGLDVCAYVQALPIDPLNGKSCGVVQMSTTTRVTTTCQYRANVTNVGEYAISARLESTQNAGKLVSDGLGDDFYSAYTSTSAVGGSTW